LKTGKKNYSNINIIEGKKNRGGMGQIRWTFDERGTGGGNRRNNFAANGINGGSWSSGSWGGGMKQIGMGEGGMKHASIGDGGMNDGMKQINIMNGGLNGGMKYINMRNGGIEGGMEGGFFSNGGRFKGRDFENHGGLSWFSSSGNVGGDDNNNNNNLVGRFVNDVDSVMKSRHHSSNNFFMGSQLDYSDKKNESITTNSTKLEASDGKPSVETYAFKADKDSKLAKKATRKEKDRDFKPNNRTEIIRAALQKKEDKGDLMSDTIPPLKSNISEESGTDYQSESKQDEEETKSVQKSEFKGESSKNLKTKAELDKQESETGKLVKLIEKTANETESKVKDKETSKLDKILKLVSEDKNVSINGKVEKDSSKDASQQKTNKDPSKSDIKASQDYEDKDFKKGLSKDKTDKDASKSDENAGQDYNDEDSAKDISKDKSKSGKKSVLSDKEEDSTKELSIDWKPYKTASNSDKRAAISFKADKESHKDSSKWFQHKDKPRKDIPNVTGSSIAVMPKKREKAPSPSQRARAGKRTRANGKRWNREFLVSLKNGGSMIVKTVAHISSGNAIRKNKIDERNKSGRL
jgi:hypothetical protein